MGATKKLGHAVQDRKSGVRAGNHRLIEAGALACRDQRDRLVGFGSGTLHIAQVTGIYLPVRRTIVDNDGKRGTRVLHHQCQAASHGLARGRSPATPGIQRIDRRQLRIQNRLQGADRLLCQLRQRHAGVMCKVHKQLPFPARVVQRHKTAGTGGMQLGKHDEHRRELVLVSRALDAIAVE